MRQKTGFIFSTLLLFAALAATGYWMLFSSFAVYDDEGYILLTARDYLAHGKLYERVYSQYGPAFYVLLDLLQRIWGSPVDNTSARLLTLTFWLGAASCCGFLVWRQNRSRSLSLFTLAATFLFLYFITDEPFHPGSLIFFSLAASLCAILELIHAGKLTGAALLAGCSGAFLLLTKINVGVFFVAGIGSWAVLHATSDQLRRRAGPWVVTVLVLLGMALMHTLVREAWVQIYLVLFAGGAIGLVLGMKGEALIKPGHAAWFLAAGTSAGFTLLALVWLRGTSFAGLLDGVLLGPLRHPGNYSYPVDWRPGSLALAGFSLSLAIAHPWFCRKFSNEFADRLIVTLRLVQAVALLVGFALLMNFRAVGAIFSYVAPLIWIWVIPLKSMPQSPTGRISRGLLATLLLLQYLHAYPVGGSQESWGVFLFIPLVALGLGEVRSWLELNSLLRPALGQWWPRLASLIVTVVIAKVGWTALGAQRSYVARSALGLPGAGQLHLPESQRTAYRILALNAVAHTDMLFSLPGMFSFNLWTDLPTPTEKNTTLWFTLLNDTEQTAIIKVLDQAPRAGLIVQESLVELMQANHIPLQGLLWDYLHRNFSVAFKTEGFAFWVRKGRLIAPLNLATARRQIASDTTARSPRFQFDFCLAHDGMPITAIEVRDEVTGSQSLMLDSTNAQVTFAPINHTGLATAPQASAPWPLSCKGLVRVLINFDSEKLHLSPTTILYLKGPLGQDSGEIRIGE